MEELFFNKSLTSGLILLGQGDKQFVFQKKMFVFFSTNIFLTNKMSNNSCHNSEPSKPCSATISSERRHITVNLNIPR